VISVSTGLSAYQLPGLFLTHWVSEHPVFYFSIQEAAVQADGVI